MWNSARKIRNDQKFISEHNRQRRAPIRHSISPSNFVPTQLQNRSKPLVRKVDINQNQEKPTAAESEILPTLEDTSESAQLMEYPSKKLSEGFTLHNAEVSDSQKQNSAFQRHESKQLLMNNEDYDDFKDTNSTMPFSIINNGYMCSDCPFTTNIIYATSLRRPPCYKSLSSDSATSRYLPQKSSLNISHNQPLKNNTSGSPHHQRRSGSQRRPLVRQRHEYYSPRHSGIPIPSPNVQNRSLYKQLSSA